MSKEIVDWTNASKAKPTGNSKILVGIDHLPAPILKYLGNHVSKRPQIKNVYHVTEILYCLRKAYWRRNGGHSEIDSEGLLNIYRGNMFDKAWTPLFEHNQHTLKSERIHPVTGELLTLTGTLDFMWLDESNLEKILYDLKMPKNTFFKKRYGAGKFYSGQVQTYLAMAHESGFYLDTHRCRVLMVADDVVVDEVPEKPSMLDLMWERIFLFHTALVDNNPDMLRGAEDDKWECNPKYCPGNVEWRLVCKDYPIIDGYPTY